MLNNREKQILEKCEEQGYLTQSDCIGIYADQSVVSRKLSEMVEEGWLAVDTAPPNSRKNKVYYLTELSEHLFRHSDS